MRRVLLLQLDGKWPSVALMRLAAHHRDRGDHVELRHPSTPAGVEPRLGDPAWDRVYASAIFQRTRELGRRVLDIYPDRALVGGTGMTNPITLESLGITTFRQDYSEYPAWRSSIGFTSRGCRLNCAFCLTPDSLILTGDGPREIADVKVGDLVLTHRGRYRRVTAVMIRPYEGPVFQLRSDALADLFPTTVTAEHEVWTRHVSYRSGGQRLTSFRWIEARNLVAGHPYRSREVFAFPRTAGEATPHKDAPWPVTAELMSLIGWYLAEGYVGSSKGRGYHRTTFCLGRSDREAGYADAIVDAAARIGLRAKAYRPSIGIRVCIESVRLARWLVEQFGTGASTKRIPLWVRLLPPDLLAPLVEAWVAGDGWVLNRNGARTCRVVTVSMPLALGLREIALRLGYVCAVNRHQTSPIILGRRVATKPAVTVAFHRPPVRRRSIVSDGENVYSSVSASEPRHYAGYVCNLEVEEDNSYCTPAFALHNCGVRAKEGAIRGEQTIADLWRGEPWPRELVLLDNDFFGQPRWRERIDEIRAGRFKVSLVQGINARLLDDEQAAALASVDYRDDSMRNKRIYTAWDAARDEARFFRGLELLVRHGVKPDHLLVYMLIGFWPGETHEDRDYRRRRLREFGARPYPMPYTRTPELVGFQRWVVGLGAWDKRVLWRDWVAARYQPVNLGSAAQEPLAI